jgi:hypothetical protein
MAQHKRAGWQNIVIVLFGAFLILLAFRIVADSGLLPGDGGTDAMAPGDETQSGSGQMDLGARPWTLLIFASTVALGAILAWAQRKTAHVPRADWQAGEAKAREIYKE